MGTINDRIFKIIDTNQNLSDSKLAKHIGCSKSAVSRWRKEGLTPHSKFTSGIADFLGVSERYLLTGEKEKEPCGFYENEQRIQHLASIVKQEDSTYTVTNEVSTIAAKIQLNPDLMELFDMCKNASPEDIKLATEMLKRMTDRK